MLRISKALGVDPPVPLPSLEQQLDVWRAARYTDALSAYNILQARLVGTLGSGSLAGLLGAYRWQPPCWHANAHCMAGSHSWLPAPLHILPPATACAAYTPTPPLLLSPCQGRQVEGKTAIVFERNLAEQLAKGRVQVGRHLWFPVGPQQRGRSAGRFGRKRRAGGSTQESMGVTRQALMPVGLLHSEIHRLYRDPSQSRHSAHTPNPTTYTTLPLRLQMSPLGPAGSGAEAPPAPRNPLAALQRLAGRLRDGREIVGEAWQGT